MRNALRKAGYSFLAATGSIALIRFGSIGYQEEIPDSIGVAAIIIGLMILPFASYFLIAGLLHARGRSKLLQGKGVIARWHVAAQEWDRFRSFDERRAATDIYRLHSELWIRKQTPAEGVDIIVGEKSLLVDGSYHVLRPRGLPELRGINWLAEAGSPECLEFLLAYPKQRGGMQPMALRIPISFDARDQARRVYQWFEPRTRRKPALAMRNPKRTYQICLILFVIGLAAIGWGYGIGKASDFSFGSESEVILPLSLIIGGGGVALFAAILALATLAITVKDGARGTPR